MHRGFPLLAFGAWWGIIHAMQGLLQTLSARQIQMRKRLEKLEALWSKLNRKVQAAIGVRKKAKSKVPPGSAMNVATVTESAHPRTSSARP